MSRQSLLLSLGLALALGLASACSSGSGGDDDSGGDDIDDTGGDDSADDDVLDDDVDDDADDDADDDSGYETWTDPTTGLMWQNGAAVGIDRLKWTDAAAFCGDLVLGGFDDWHLPTIGELRSLLRGCGATQTGGSCGVTDDCLTRDPCRDDSCDGCEALAGAAAGGAYWPAELTGDINAYWSSSESDTPDAVWHLYFSDGYLDDMNIQTEYSARCVRNEPADDDIDDTDDDATTTTTWESTTTTVSTTTTTMETTTTTVSATTTTTMQTTTTTVYVTTTMETTTTTVTTTTATTTTSTIGDVWTDALSGLTWQVNPTYGTTYQGGAITYCANLALDGGGWHLPTISELSTLIQGCDSTGPGGSCPVSDSCVLYECWDPSLCSCTNDQGPNNGCYGPAEFPSSCGRYWSSSTLVYYGYPGGWYVNFNNGAVTPDYDNLQRGARCVR